MSRLGYLLVYLSFSLPRLIAAIPAEGPALATTRAPQLLEPRQTDQANFVGWYPTGSTYSPYYCPSACTFCTSSTFVGCNWKTASTCSIIKGCAGVACGAGSRCYTATLHPATTDDGRVVTTFVNCLTGPPPELFRAEPTSSKASSRTASTTRPTSASSTDAPPDPAPEPPSSPGLSTGAKIGIGVGASAGGSSIIIIIILWWRRNGNKIRNIIRIKGDGNHAGQALAMAATGEATSPHAPKATSNVSVVE